MEKSTGIHWRIFEVLCTPKSLGGLGFKKFQTMNTALLTKQVWRLIQDPSSYWAATLKGIYFPKTDFLYANKGRRTSWVWKSLLHGRYLVKAEGKWQIEAGLNVNIEEDLWLASGAKAILQPNASVSKVGDLIGPNHEWNLSLLRNNPSSKTAI